MRWTTIETLELLESHATPTDVTELAREQLRNRAWLERTLPELVECGLVERLSDDRYQVAETDATAAFRRLTERFEIGELLSPYRERLLRCLHDGPRWIGELPTYNRPYMRRGALADLERAGVVVRDDPEVRLTDDDLRTFLDRTPFYWAGEVGTETTGNAAAEDETVMRTPELLTELERLDDGLTEPTEVFLIGGGVLTLSGVRAGTHDLDLLVADDQETAQRLVESHPAAGSAMEMVGLGHHLLFQPSYDGTYYPPFELPADGGGDVQVFWGRIANTVTLTDGIRSRSRVFEPGWLDCLDVRCLSPSDILLTVATKRGEVPFYDVRRLLTTVGVDWDAVFSEARAQTDATGIVYAPALWRLCRTLSRRTASSVPVRRARRLAAEQTIPIRLAEPCSRATLTEALPFSPAVLDDALARLRERGAVAGDDERLRLAE